MTACFTTGQIGGLGGEHTQGLAELTVFVLPDPGFTAIPSGAVSAL